MTFPGARPVTAPGWTGQPKTDLALIDCDVHHKVKKVEELFPYLPRVYREPILEQGFRSAGSGYFNVTRTAVRTDLAEGAPLAARLTKRGIVRATGIDLEAQVRYELANIRRAFATEDAQEARRAFFEKRSPTFRGR
ncbi:MAG TPA: hypothetical protein VGM69_24090 [Chloroflexota bacterium]|jgi:enoyl-CoA hydratase/carnithine racemase